MFYLINLIFISSFTISPLCMHQARVHGDGAGQDELPLFCIDEYKNTALPQAYKTNSKGFVAASHNLIVMGLPHLGKGYITGNSTELEQITALAIDSLNNEIIIYDKESFRLLFFSSLISGNISPSRVYSSDKLREIKDVTVHEKKGEIHLLGTNKIFVYSRIFHKKNGKKQPLLLRIIEDIPTDISSMAIIKDKIYLGRLDRIFVHSLDNFNIPLGAIKIPPSLGSFSINYLKDEDKLFLRGDEKSFLLPHEKFIFQNNERTESSQDFVQEKMIYDGV